METIHFHIAHIKIVFEDNFVSRSGGPKEQFGTYEKLSWGCKVTLMWCRGIGYLRLWSVPKVKRTPTSNLFDCFDELKCAVKGVLQNNLICLATSIQALLWRWNSVIWPKAYFFKEVVY